MKRFNEFIKQLSLTQQLFALIFFFVTFFAVFFFVYVNGSVNNAIKEQIFKSLDDTQSTLISANATLDAYSNASNIENYPVMIKNGDTPILIAPAEKNIDTNSREWEQIRNDLLKVMRGNLEKYHGIFKNASNDLDSYYSILRITDKQYLISKTYSDNMDKLENVLVNSVVYITVIVVGFFFIVLMMWVITLIHPLNQIRNYIERVKLGKDAELHVNRKDEIGELADALVSMRDELLREEKTKEEMIHNISHDLKTPLTSIINYVDLLKRENPQDPKIQGYLEILEEKSLRLKTLTEDVVEASKAST